MKAILTCLVACLFAGSAMAIQGSGKYRVNDAEIDAQFEQAAEMQFVAVENGWDIMTSEKGVDAKVIARIRADKDPQIAGIMAIGEIVLGLVFIPAHRIYLGTDTGTIIGYVLTCGGFGIITLIDAIVLLTDEDPDRFMDNPKFFMWSK